MSEDVFKKAGALINPITWFTGGSDVFDAGKEVIQGAFGSGAEPKNDAPVGPTPEDPALDAARKNQRTARGRASTILTGRSLSSEPVTARKTLLGGL